MISSPYHLGDYIIWCHSCSRIFQFTIVHYWERTCLVFKGKAVLNLPWLKMIIWVTAVLRRTVVCNWRFDNLCRSHLQTQVIVLVSWKFKTLVSAFEFLTKTITWLWRWLLHRLSKRQLQTTVLLRIPVTQMICFNQGMLLLGSNHVLI